MSSGVAISAERMEGYVKSNWVLVGLDREETENDLKNEGRVRRRKKAKKKVKKVRCSKLMEM